MNANTAIFRALNWHSRCLSATYRNDMKFSSKCAKMRDECLKKAGFENYSKLFQEVIK